MIKNFFILLGLLSKLFFYVSGWIATRRLAKCGRNVRIARGCRFSYNTVYMGDDIFVGEFASFSSAEAKIFIGNKVMFGPRVALIGGDHRFDDIVGQYMFDVAVPKSDDHGDIIVEDDCWICYGAIILKGVKIGRGSVIGAGAVVTKSIPPYSIVTGVPAQRIRRRWREDIIAEHESMLSHLENR